ncbi:MAG: phosphoribosylamine--glycine ligase [Arsenophonus sp.]|nr:MAG: phosphoribosylamine--glycine ligase [Arsenophonus sp.]
MNILIIGSGAREHAIAWKISQSQNVKKIYIIPGNAGTSLEKKIKNVKISCYDIEQILYFAKKKNVVLTIVVSEFLLSLGIVDYFKKAKLNIFGPNKNASLIESSKSFAKDLMSLYSIPTAKYQVFNKEQEALKYLFSLRPPFVIKANGLAKGKGVIITSNMQESKKIVRNMLNGKLFKESGRKIIIEEYIYGKEISFMIIVDKNKNIIPLEISCDYKKLLNNNYGPNTGGMGSYSPYFINDAVYNKIMNNIIYPIVDALYIEGFRYEGFLYIGIMIDKNSCPKVIECNCRLGDPEIQSVIVRLKSDFIDLCFYGLCGKLDLKKIFWNRYYALTVVMCSKDYPILNSYKEEKIFGLKNNLQFNMCKIFHAGTKFKENCFFTNGGRVLSVTAIGKTKLIAKKNAYKKVKSIFWNNCYYRTDIGI